MKCCLGTPNSDCGERAGDGHSGDGTGETYPLHALTLLFTACWLDRRDYLAGAEEDRRDYAAGAEETEPLHVLTVQSLYNLPSTASQ